MLLLMTDAVYMAVGSRPQEGNAEMDNPNNKEWGGFDMVVGLFLGIVLGFFTAALLAAGRDDNDRSA